MRVEIDNCLPAFKNAHQAILESCGPTLPKMKVLVNQWHQKYGVRIIRKNHGDRMAWIALEFKSKEHYIEWLLKWSG